MPYAVSLLLVVLLLQCTAAQASQQPPLVSRITKDATSSLYTISIKDDAPLLVDLAGPLVWSTCPSPHATVPCQFDTCRAANQQRPRRCRYVDAGAFWAGREPPAWGCACAAHPFNPVTGECSTGDLTSFAMSANTTNGTDLLYPEAFAAVGGCAPGRLLASLPAAATGVAGFSRDPLSLRSQLAAQRGFGGRFALCLPAFAAFGGTPVYLGTESRGLVEYTGSIPYAPLLANPRNPSGYYIPVKGISMSWHGVDVAASLPNGALDLDGRTGRGGVVLSTVTPGKVTDVKRVPAVKPFQLCYNGAFPLLKRPVSYDVDGAMCVGILEMEPGAMPVDGEPAAVIGGKTIENNLLVFDLEKGVLGFSLLDFQSTSCYSSNLSRL
ncbi:hypothetical protein SETIT_5G446100v2 [Setaria italica]|uniref:Peptidase A1 domain-containing protein n=1 Tax=Setaria italica TaxID=4555 RepID=A0A368RFY4_SETIT|nr:hypothetical protein SETIT_5G446100v2 [Setaria italica]